MNHSSEQWVPINHYSVQTGMSISTIRRRIKNKKIPYRFVEGKYYLPLHIKKETPTREKTMLNLPHIKKPQTTPQKTQPQDEILKRDRIILKLRRENEKIQNQLEQTKILLQLLEDRYQIRY